MGSIPFFCVFTSFVANRCNLYIVLGKRSKYITEKSIAQLTVTWTDMCAWYGL